MEQNTLIKGDKVFISIKPVEAYRKYRYQVGTVVGYEKGLVSVVLTSTLPELPTTTEEYNKAIKHALPTLALARTLNKLDIGGVII